MALRRLMGRETFRCSVPGQARRNVAPPTDAWRATWQPEVGRCGQVPGSRPVDHYPASTSRTNRVPTEALPAPGAQGRVPQDQMTLGSDILMLPPSVPATDGLDETRIWCCSAKHPNLLLAAPLLRHVSASDGNPPRGPPCRFRRWRCRWIIFDGAPHNRRVAMVGLPMDLEQGWLRRPLLNPARGGPGATVADRRRGARDRRGSDDPADDRIGIPHRQTGVVEHVAHRTCRRPRSRASRRCLPDAGFGLNDGTLGRAGSGDRWNVVAEPQPLQVVIVENDEVAW